MKVCSNCRLCALRPLCVTVSDCAGCVISGRLTIGYVTILLRELLAWDGHLARLQTCVCMYTRGTAQADSDF